MPAGSSRAGGFRELEALVAEVARLADTPGEEAGTALAERLEHPSWYLRERVVQALGMREDGAERVARTLREGAWWARASACDVLARRADAARMEDILAAVEDPNVSLQKSAVSALVAISAVAGAREVARHVAALVPERRRRVMARVGHQAPEWTAQLQDALETLPPAAFTEGRPAEVPVSPFEAAETRALLRFRTWLRREPAAPAAGERT